MNTRSSEQARAALQHVVLAVFTVNGTLCITNKAEIFSYV